MSWSLFFVPANAVLDVPVSDFNKMNSLAYNASCSFPFEHYTSCNKNEGITLNELIKSVKDHENYTSIIEDTVLINLGTLDEQQEFKIGNSLALQE